MQNSPTIAGFLQCNGGKLEETETANVFSSFIVCKNRNRSALLRELLSNNSPFVGQLYEGKSLALRAHNLSPLYPRKKIRPILASSYN